MILLLVSNLSGQIHTTSVEAQITTPNSIETEIHLLINQERREADPSLPELRLHSTLIEIARAHSEDMYTNNFFDHVNREGLDPADRIVNRGITYSLVAENLYMAENIPEERIVNSAVNGWINSEGHYRNMLSFTSYTGIGVFTKNNVYFITQIFVQASENDMKSLGTLFDNNNFEKQPEPSFIERYQQELVLLSLILLVVFLGKRGEALNRQSRR